MPRTPWRSITSAWLLLWPIPRSRRPQRSRNYRLSRSSCRFTFKINCRSRDRPTRISSSCRTHNIGLSSVAIRIRSSPSTFTHAHTLTREFCCYKHHSPMRIDRQIDCVSRAFLDEFEHVPPRVRTLLRSERFLKSRTIIMFHRRNNLTWINVVKMRNLVLVA